MNLKNKFVLLILISFITCVLGVSVWYFSKNDKPSTNNNSLSGNETHKNETSIDIPQSGNDTIITTKADTSLRFINEYTTEFFTADKNLLIMFGSWCSHCSEELKDIEKILNHYKDNKDVNVILIAHEYESTISDLITIVEQDFDFGNRQILIDLKRVMRKKLDPEANTVPISYVVDKKGNLLQKHDSAITLDIAKDMLI